MECCWFDNEDEPRCGEEATLFGNLPLCDEHALTAKLRVRRSRMANALQAAQYHSFDAFPGFCYIILLPDGCIKIGYSNTEKLLDKRFKSLSRAYKAPVLPLVVIPGGFVAEAVLHDRFEVYRVPGDGERFYYSPEIAEYIATLTMGTKK